MKKNEKEVVITKLHERFNKAKVYILSSYSGMGVEEIRTVKTAIRKSQGQFNVVKNRLAIRAAKGTALEKVSAHFKGPVALTIGFGDVVSTVKALSGVMKDQEKLKMKAGVIESRVVDLAGFMAVAKLPSKEVMLGQLVVRMKSPLYGVAFALGGLLGKFVGVLHAVQGAREQSGK
jgi:large subunit ribosomal protein L10